MSLKDPDEDYEELAEGTQKKRKNKMGKAAKKLRLFAIILIIGMIIGGFIGMEYIAPILNGEGNTQSCEKTKELLSKENGCLYKALDNPQEIIKQCNDPNP